MSYFLSIYFATSINISHLFSRPFHYEQTISFIFLGIAIISLVLFIFFIIRFVRFNRTHPPIKKPKPQLKNVSPTVSKETFQPKSRLTAFLLCFFLGDFGAHRFYVGRTKSAVLWLLTLGLFNVGSFVDLIMILTGSFRDAQGNLLIEWDPASSKSSVSPSSSLSSLASSPPPPPPAVSSPVEVEIIFCPHCSAKNLASQQFCGSCGERLISSAPTSTR